MTLAAIQNRISTQFPSITKDHVYKASWAITTVAMTALSYYAPITFFFIGMPLSLAHVIMFNAAVSQGHPDDHSIIKHWMTIACLVSSAFITVQISYFFYCLPWGVQALKVLDMSEALFNLTLFTGSIGFGSSAVKTLFNRGLELAQTETWEPMKAHMATRQSQKQVSGFFDKWEFAIGLIDPENLSFSAKMRNVLFKFIPQASQEQKFKQLLADYHSVANVDPAAAAEYWPQILEYFNTMPINKQLAELNQMIAIRGIRVMNELKADTVQAYGRRVIKVGQQNETIASECRTQADEIYTRIDAIKDPKLEKETLDQISIDLSALRTRIEQHALNMKLFCPKARIPEELTALQKELMTGEKSMQLFKMNSQAADAEEIDLDDATWNYFLISYTKEVGRGGGGEQFVGRLCGKFNVALPELDGKLDELKIGTIGEFIQTVLGGDKKILANPEEVMLRIDEYLATKNDARGLIYSTLASKAITHSSFAVQLAGKVAYKAAMIMTAVAPIIVYPKLVAFSAVVSMVYYSVPFVNQTVDYYIEDIFKRRYGFILSLATRRPFISLLTNTSSGEMASYSSSDTLGKMRILATEFFLGFLLLNATFDDRGNLEGLGAIVTGMAIAREAHGLAGRTWRRITA
jgi:hypothetical protein